MGEARAGHAKMVMPTTGRNSPTLLEIKQRRLSSERLSSSRVAASVDGFWGHCSAHPTQAAAMSPRALAWQQRICDRDATRPSVNTGHFALAAPQLTGG